MIVRFLLLFLLLPSLAAPEPPPLILRLVPQVGYRPLQVQATLIIEPNYLNRGVCLSWDTGGACWSLNGQYEARIQSRDLPGPHYAFETGVYTVTVTLLRVGAPNVVIPAQTITVLHRE